MIRAFFRLSAIFMRVHECGVVVVVCMVVRAMCELTERTASVLVGHVPVVVAMDLSGMAMLVGLSPTTSCFVSTAMPAPPFIT